MPFYLKEVDVVPEVTKFKSALIVPCRFCPAVSFALRKQQTYIELFKRFLKTESYEQHINNMQSRLEKEGLKTNVFKSNLLNFVFCMCVKPHIKVCVILLNQQIARCFLQWNLKEWLTLNQNFIYLSTYLLNYQV
jgi:elongation factor P--beta-lysine ligase